ncbi:D-alanine--D-alanine ligase [Bacillus thuringiensis]|uniref:D-alanine--D-alanine ligase n=1 Tax=Bacillus thuringiensis HD-771 TaxID=1218175 RepID=A0A9W3J603_BACTU|nr:MULTISPECIES: D-alanine--D-alanine ligase [Bacillus cereus group]EEM41663.1 D-alanine--D-alanine ligase [Bacillus thuringiensis serovar sotto str. T04001]AFQ14822.1 D-alanyl-alanine synthetase A [Bacillus thuringiensis HD-771]AZV69396.1 D-alanine--D-alanine ligase [Bacillus cereus]MCU5622656.1 D-alanine--D-alanine ligase [Bacillus cereus]MDA2099664.1 D-alanine--D-alanine ligase [Bacillus cereus]
MKIGVIMGGVSSEKQVSIMTGNEMIAHLDKNKYEIVPITLNEKMDLIEKAKDIDFALLALHGKYGEDGTVQGTLESLGIPYSGSNMLSSSICMDKNISKKILRYEGVETPDWIELTKMEDLKLDELDKLGFPLVVKPNSGGSSVGVKIVYNKNELISMLETVFEWDSEVVIEKYVKGDEITCSILDGKQLPIVSIRHAAEFFDYNAKYDDTSTVEEVIELPAEINERVNKASLACYKVLKCSVYARVDMMVKDGIPYVMEINTLPGMTQSSLLPKSAEAAGISYSKLLDMIIETSLKVRKEEGF